MWFYPAGLLLILPTALLSPMSSFLERLNKTAISLSLSLPHSHPLLLSHLVCMWVSNLLPVIDNAPHYLCHFIFGFLGKPHAEPVCMLGAPANDSENSPLSTHIHLQHKFKGKAGSSALATRFYQLVQMIVFSNRLRPLFNPTRVKGCSEWHAHVLAY